MAPKKNLRMILAVGIGLIVIGTLNQPVVADSPGSQVYKKICKKCHGKQGHGKKSKTKPGQFKYPPLHEMSEEDLPAALIKYREMWQKKNYGNKTKGMAKRAGRLSDEEMKAVAAFITSQLSPQGE